MFDKGLVPRHSEERKDDGEEFGKGGEGFKVEGQVGAEAGRLGRVEDCARGGADRRMRRRGDGRDGRKGWGKAFFCVGEEDR